MRIPRQIAPKREAERRQETDETSQSAAVSDAPLPLNQPVGSAPHIDPDRAGAGARPGGTARPVAGPQMALLSALDAGALRSREGAPFSSADIARILVRLTEDKTSQPAVFAPAAEVLKRLKRLMEHVEARRQTANVRTGHLRQPIDAVERDQKRREDVPPRRPS